MDTPKLPDVPERINVAHQTTVEEMSSDMEMSSRGLLKHRDIRFRLNEIFRLQENDVNPEESSEGRDKRGSTISQSSRSMDIEKDEVHHWVRLSDFSFLWFFLDLWIAGHSSSG